MEITPSPLPRRPSYDREWDPYRYAYALVLSAEYHANEQGGKDNLVFARVTGFLLIELFKKRKILSLEPCASLALEILSPPLVGTTDDLVFKLGKWYNRYLMCARAIGSSPVSFGSSVSLQIVRPPGGTQHHICTSHLPSSTT